MPASNRFPFAGLLVLALAVSGCDAASGTGGSAGLVGLVRGVEANRVVEVTLTDATGAALFAVQGEYFAFEDGEADSMFEINVTPGSFKRYVFFD